MAERLAVEQMRLDRTGGTRIYALSVSRCLFCEIRVRNTHLDLVLYAGDGYDQKQPGICLILSAAALLPEAAQAQAGFGDGRVMLQGFYWESYRHGHGDPKDEEILPESCTLRSCKYLNNIIEQDHRFIKRRVKPGLGFWSFQTAWRTLRGYEVMNMVRKGQRHGVPKGDIVSQNRMIAQIFGLAACMSESDPVFSP